MINRADRLRAKRFWDRVRDTLSGLFKFNSAMPVRRRQSLASLRVLEDRCLLSVTPVGTEFRVNTYTQGSQQTFQQTPQAVAVNPATGDYVVAWSSQGQN